MLILRAQGSSTFYLHVYDGWLSASTVDGPWSQTIAAPSGLDDVAHQLAESGQVDLLTAAMRSRSQHSRMACRLSM